MVRVDPDKLSSRRLSVPNLRLQEERPQYVETAYYFNDQTKERGHRKCGRDPLNTKCSNRLYEAFHKSTISSAERLDDMTSDMSRLQKI